MTSTNFDIHDLDWAAYCYAAGVLPSDKTEQFEALLEESQAAREAVARAVELTETIVAAGPIALEPAAESALAPALSKSPAWMRVAGWLSLATAASLALVMVGRQPTEIASRGPVPSATADGRPGLERLTAAWIASRTDADAGIDEDTDPADESSFEELAADDAEFLAPSWLTAAVSGAALAPQGDQE